MDFKDDFITVVDNDEFVLLERKFIITKKIRKKYYVEMIIVAKQKWGCEKAEWQNAILTI